ncbi:UPF0481 protein [Canna indica]|uniref:UPF0481 protein n=1 Tax=Canna indica TaxID=4628 RepID=A0AAQ3QD03_9LILI|nr:UPF0481 protein [Canna indica]
MNNTLEKNVLLLLDQMDGTGGSFPEKMKEDIQWKPWLRTEKPTIFRVPEIIRGADPDAYEPNIVSLGPYHRGKPRLQAVDKHKWHYLEHFLSRNRYMRLEDYLDHIKSMEDRARSAYAEELEMDSSEFIKMMLLDGCFVVEFLIRVNNRTEVKEKEERVVHEQDPIFSSHWAEYYVRLDMLLLENQLPLFLVRSLLGLVAPDTADQSLKPLALKFFGADFLPGRTKRITDDRLPDPVLRSHHILHLLHACINPPRHEPPPPPPSKWLLLPKLSIGRRETKQQPRRHHGCLPTYGSMSRYCCCCRRQQNQYKIDDDTVFTPLTPATIPCARELKEAGVAIRRKKVTDSFLDITFIDGRLEIPRLRAYNVSNAILRNLIAFEQLYPDRGTHVTDFAYMMDCLIDTPEDVALLREEGILVSAMGSNKAVTVMFNNLCKRVVVEPKKGHLGSVFEDIPKHCERRANRWRATLNHTYFGNPWTIISVIAAISLFLLTITQTVLAIVTLVHP